MGRVTAESGLNLGPQRRQVGRFNRWFDIPQPLSASKNEDNKRLLFLSVICSEALGAFVFTCSRSERGVEL